MTLLLGSTVAEAQTTQIETAGGSSEDRGLDVVIDGAGNRYVAGYFQGSPDFDDDGQSDATSAGDDDVFVAKYDASGTFQWVSTAGGSGPDNGLGIAIDGAGNSYVTGYFKGSADFDGDGQPDVTAAGGTNDDDVFIARYDDTGALQWVLSAGSQFAPEAGEGISVTATGDVLLAGSIGGNADFDDDGQADVTAPGSGDLFVAKYDDTGSFQWANAGGGFLIDQGLGIDVDDAGNSYVTGVFSGSADLNGDGQTDVNASGGFTQNAFVAKYDAAGALVWANAAGGSMLARGQDIAVTGSGVSVVTGSFQGDADFDGDGQTDVSSIGSADVFVAKYDATGGLEWVNGAGGNDFDEGFGIATDADGAAYVTGYFQLTPGFLGADFDGDGQVDVSGYGGLDVFVAKYTPSGALGAVNGAGGDFNDRGDGIGTDDAGNAFVTGSFEDEADFDGDDQADVTATGSDDVFLARYDASVLPVELAGFSGQFDGEAVGLVWQTLSETNNAGFDVERRTEGGSWSRVGFVDGAGTTAEPQRYRFTDARPPYDATRLRYRLRQVDADGTESVSEPITVRRAAGIELQKTTPNPVRGVATLRYAVPRSETMRLALYDVLGREVRTIATGAGQGRIDTQLDLSGLASGTYFLRLEAAGQVMTRPLTVVR